MVRFSSSPAERHLRVVLDANPLKGRQCALIARGCIWRCMASYYSLVSNTGEVRSEYCILFGVSQFNRDVKKLGRVWWRGTETVRAEGTCPARRSWGGWLA